VPQLCLNCVSIDEENKEVENEWVDMVTKNNQSQRVRGKINEQYIWSLSEKNITGYSKENVS